MHPEFSERPAKLPYRVLDISSPPKGDTIYQSLPAGFVAKRTHYVGRTLPCMKAECPLCDYPARDTLWLPCVVEGSTFRRLISLPGRGEFEDLLDAWPTGVRFKIERRGNRCRLVAFQSSVYTGNSLCTDDDVVGSLCRAWSLPTPMEFLDVELWRLKCCDILRRVIQTSGGQKNI